MKAVSGIKTETVLAIIKAVYVISKFFRNWEYLNSNDGRKMVLAATERFWLYPYFFYKELGLGLNPQSCLYFQAY